MLVYMYVYNCTKYLFLKEKLGGKCSNINFFANICIYGACWKATSNQ